MLYSAAPRPLAASPLKKTLTNLKRVATPQSTVSHADSQAKIRLVAGEDAARVSVSTMAHLLLDLARRADAQARPPPS